MLLRVQRDALQEIPPVCLEGTSVVRDWHAGESPDQPVGHPGRYLPQEELVLPLTPPATHQIVPLLELCDESRDVPRIVLKIPVQRDDDSASSVIETRHHGGGLTYVAAQPKSHHAPVNRHGPDLIPGVVLAPIVDQDDFEGTGEGFQGLKDPLNQRTHVLPLI